MRLQNLLPCLAVLACFSTSAMADPVHKSCSLSSNFKLQKLYNSNDPSNGVSWSIIYKGKIVYAVSTAELREIFGGKAPQTDCSDIYIGNRFFAFRLGWERDLLLAFGYQLKNGRLVNFQKMHFYPHDFAMNMQASGNELTVVFGRDKDLLARFCWNPNSKGQWWHNEHPRHGLGPCVDSSWPYAYPNTGVEKISSR